MRLKEINLSVAEKFGVQIIEQETDLDHIKRDKDNIAFAKKFIQDSLVHMGVLENDGWKNIEYFTDSFGVDPKDPRVEVVIEDYEGGKNNGSKSKN